MIVTLTPSPSLDRTVSLSGAFRPGLLNRVSTARENAGGKGLNVLRVISRLGGEAVGAVPLAGENGRTFMARAATEGLYLLTGGAAGETRCCTIVLQDDPPHPTEINEPGAHVSQENWLELLRTIAGSHPELIVVSGTLPPGTEASWLLGRLAALTPKKRIVVDGSGATLLAAVRLGVRLISPNMNELEQLCDALGWDERGRQAAVRVHREYGVQVLLSDGPSGAGWFGDANWWADLGRDLAGNPIGSGDTLLGAYLWMLCQLKGAEGNGTDAQAEALRFGVAAAAANVTGGGGALIDPAKVNEYLPHVDVVGA